MTRSRSASADPALGEIQRQRPAVALDRAQPMAEGGLEPVPREQGQRRLDQAGGEALARDQRPAAGSTARKALLERRP